MRGKVNIPEYNETLDRITPAYAGKSIDQLKYGAISEDHPRLCGEKCQCCIWGYPCEGSPPPMRGKALDKTLSIPKDGITPAYAGKSSRIPRLHLRERDHPRLCGEKHSAVRCTVSRKGSPPPMRGKGNTGDIYARQFRITPAYAGKRSQFENLGNTE